MIGKLFWLLLYALGGLAWLFQMAFLVWGMGLIFIIGLVCSAPIAFPLWLYETLTGKRKKERETARAKAAAEQLRKAVRNNNEGEETPF